MGPHGNSEQTLNLSPQRPECKVGGSGPGPGSEGGWLPSATAPSSPGRSGGTHPRPLPHAKGLQTAGRSWIHEATSTSTETQSTEPGTPPAAHAEGCGRPRCLHSVNTHSRPPRGAPAAARPGRPAACARPRHRRLRVPPAPRSSAGRGRRGREQREPSRQAEEGGSAGRGAGRGRRREQRRRPRQRAAAAAAAARRARTGSQSSAGQRESKSRRNCSSASLGRA